MSEIITNGRHIESNEISMELSNETFANVILDFLGKKEKLKYEDEICFLMRLNDIEQFYYLINDKVSKEHNVFIDHFLLSVTYNDNTIREVSGIDSLNKFIETRDVYPKDITLTWNILVKYPEAKTIENQKIELTFITNHKDKEAGRVILVISHTNQSWGIEVFNLVKNKISEVSIKPKKVYYFAKNIRNHFNEGMYSLYVLLFMMATFMYTMVITLEPIGSEHYYKLVNAWEQNPQSKEIEMLAFATKYMNGSDLLEYSTTNFKDGELKNALIEISKVKTQKDEGNLKKLV